MGLVEVYDLDQTDTGTLANVSTRGEVLVGDNVMIGGLIITGPNATNVLLRASRSFPVHYWERWPIRRWKLYDRDGVVIAVNDNWRSDQQADIIRRPGIPPLNDAESAIFATLVPSSEHRDRPRKRAQDRCRAGRSLPVAVGSEYFFQIASLTRQTGL